MVSYLFLFHVLLEILSRLLFSEPMVPIILYFATIQYLTTFKFRVCTWCVVTVSTLEGTPGPSLSITHSWCHQDGLSRGVPKRLDQI